MSTEQRALFLSLRPRFAELLLEGEKTVELRRVPPALSCGALVLMYASSPVQALVGAGTVMGIEVATQSTIWARHGQNTGLSRREYDSYFAGANVAVAISLANVTRLDEPLSLFELRQCRSWFQPPQSFRYLDQQQVASFGLGLGSPATEGRAWDSSIPITARSPA